MPTDKRVVCLTAAAAMVAPLLLAANARADLKESQVLVVYDSRIADSRAVAEYYAGSLKVPGGTGGMTGVHPGVNAVDIASLPSGGLGNTIVGDITYAQFVTNYRNPLRSYLTSQNLAKTVRSIVLTRGIPTRILDTDVPTAGDQPGQAGSEINAGDVTYASVDSELTVLFQSLETGEAGGTGDSKSDGLILNPYWRANQPISGWSTQSLTGGKLFLSTGGFTGIIWRNFTSGPVALTPGDMYLVCRLDGNTPQQIIAAIDRAQNLTVNLDTATLLLDESGSNGVQNTSDVDTEYDNDGPVAYTNGGDDYEQTRDLLLADGRFAPANVRYDSLSGSSNFFVGPLVNYGGGIVVNTPVLLLATYGANHSGTPGNAGTTYPTSFNYAPGAIFNTIESYNGRAFENLGVGFTPQAQLSDFIASGGTFGLGNVQEPFSFTVPDNLMLVQNFLLGNLSWGEAAYTSLPGLSWQQIVVGDPLAKVRRTREDVNGDGANNVEDLYAFFSSPNPPDLNRSGAADVADARLLEASLRQGESGNMWPPSGR